jgi:hypothetical protein
MWGNDRTAREYRSDAWSCLFLSGVVESFARYRIRSLSRAVLGCHRLQRTTTKRSGLSLQSALHQAGVDPDFETTS